MKIRYLVLCVLLASAVQGFATSPQDDFEEKKPLNTSSIGVEQLLAEIETLRTEISKQGKQIEDLKKGIDPAIQLETYPSHKRTMRVGVTTWLPFGLGCLWCLSTGDVSTGCSITSNSFSIGYVLQSILYKIDDTYVPVKEKAK